MERLNLSIVFEGTLANVALTPTLRDQVVTAQKNNTGMEKIRQRLMEMILGLHVFTRTVRVSCGLIIV